MQNVIWKPQPRQQAFMERGEYEAFYGGAAGGGKSDVLVIEALRQVHIPHYKGIIFRKTYTQLGELLAKADSYYPRIFPGAKYNSQQHVWKFPSGARIYFAGMQYLKDRTKWQGWQFDFIGFDELTHFQFDEYSYMWSRNRASGKGTRVYMRATGNPGGIGHGWVKNRFVTVAPPMTPVKKRLEIVDADGNKITRWRHRIFVPAKLTDNKILMENSPEYMQSLAMLPQKDREALLDGNWDSFSGQVFMEWRNDPDHYTDHKYSHVIEPFRIPSHWKIMMGYDWGYSKPFACLWVAVDEQGKYYVIRELYGCTGEPNKGVMWDDDRIAKEIRRVEEEDLNLRGKHIERIADPAIFDTSRGGKEGSQARTMERSGVYFEKGDHTRIAGKMQIHHRLRFDDIGECMLQFFNTCPHTIRTLPSLVYSEIDVEDVDSSQEDHLYDVLRYLCMRRKITPKPVEAKKYDPFDPLEQRRPRGYGYL
jgi:hypothetical protein